jgi:hypothetical protein
MAIKREVVNSTCLRSIGHDPADRRLELEFRKSGAVYGYDGVTTRTANALKRANSRGRFFNKNIRNADYPYERLRSGRRRRKAKRTR